MGTKHGNATHGMSRTPIYNIWKLMKYRCLDPGNSAYKNYGGRGITVCERWKIFDNFYEDMGGSYMRGLSIERIDNEQGYCPENCKWIPRCDQNKNTRKIRLITFKGKTMSISDWARYLGMKQSTLSMRFHYKWSVKRCLEREVTWAR